MARSVSTAAPRSAARYLWILAISLSALLVFWPSLKTAISLALTDERYLQIVLAPLGCVFLILRERRAIFAQARYSPRPGIPLLALAMLLAMAVAPVSGSLGLLLAVFAIVLVLMAAFVLCYGTRSFRAALYPLCCLFAMVPLLPSWMDRVAAVLQHGSASISYEILRLTGVPVFRRGTLFALPGLTFEVGLECSGIRSGLAMMMVAIAVGYVYLRSGWTRSALILLTIPIVLFKNSVRIVVITMMGAYVDRIFLDGPLHHLYGGLVFTVLGVALLVLVLLGLQKLERLYPKRAVDSPQPGRAVVVAQCVAEPATKRITGRRYSPDSLSARRP